MSTIDNYEHFELGLNMCGIAGIFNFDKQPVRVEQLSAMTNNMIERGPDDDGFYTSGSVGLGFRRLSIIDLEGGHQPLTNEDKTLFLVFNGEIYNHIELHDQLISRGHIFRTKSDAEVLLHLYEEKGIDALEDLNGMFSFALYDKKRDELFMARDRLGIKPLFYTITCNRIVFASDVRALREEINTKLDTSSVIKYIALAYVPGAETMWTGIKKLLPAHYLLISANGDIKCQRYWKACASGSWQGSLVEAKAQLDEYLTDAVRLQMRSDVPVGIFLSGGVDSSALVSYASSLTEEPLRTYTINFSGKNSEDAKYAEFVAKRYKTIHCEIQVSAADIEREMDNLLGRMDEPISDSAIFPAYLVSKTAYQQGVKVLLNGAGGDEIFGGYSRHWPPRIGSPTWVAETLPGVLGTLISTIWSKFQPHRGVRASNPVFSWVAGVSGVNLNACSQLFRKSAMFTQMIGAIKEEYSKINHTAGAKNYTYDRMELDLNTYLPSDVLALTDKATMAASVECRVPLLDHRLVEFAYSLPVDINLTGGKPKGLFRDVLASKLPAELLNRKKEGFNAPITEWMQMRGFLNLEDELLGRTVSIVDNLIDKRALSALLANERESRHASETLFSLYLLNRWCRIHSID